MRSELQDRLLTLEGDTTSVEIWEVVHISPSEIYSMTWNKKPVRVNELGSLVAVFGINSTIKPFPCPEHSSLLLELTCPSSGCWVEYEIMDDLFGQYRFDTCASLYINQFIPL